MFITKEGKHIITGSEQQHIININTNKIWK